MIRNQCLWGCRVDGVKIVNQIIAGEGTGDGIEGKQGRRLKGVRMAFEVLCKEVVEFRTGMEAGGCRHFFFLPQRLQIQRGNIKPVSEKIRQNAKNRDFNVGLLKKRGF